MIRSGITHGVTGYKRHRCRCAICCKAREADLELRREREANRKKKDRHQSSRFEYDTVTLGQYRKQQEADQLEQAMRGDQ
jgi:hypothetical protein